MNIDVTKCMPLAFQATLYMRGSMCGLSPSASAPLGSKGAFEKKMVGYALGALAKVTTAVCYPSIDEEAFEV